MDLESCHEITKYSVTSGQESVGIELIYETKAAVRNYLPIFHHSLPFQAKSHSPPNPDFLCVTPHRARRYTPKKSRTGSRN